MPAQLAIDCWMALGPQIDAGAPKGRVELGVGYLWIENSTESNKTIH